jgi:uncharacterized protein
MDQGIIEIVNRYVELVKTRYSIEQSIVFGSYAKNKESQHSDIDIAFVFAKLSDSEKFDTQIQLMLLASEVDTRIEPHPISKKDFSLNTPFVNEIKRTGIQVNVH